MRSIMEQLRLVAVLSVDKKDEWLRFEPTPLTCFEVDSKSPETTPKKRALSDTSTGLS